jgi:hypothetical protein
LHAADQGDAVGRQVLDAESHAGVGSRVGEAEAEDRPVRVELPGEALESEDAPARPRQEEQRRLAPPGLERDQWGRRGLPCPLAEHPGDPAEGCRRWIAAGALGPPRIGGIRGTGWSINACYHTTG